MNDAQPRISVILPTRNRAALLPRAITSVLEQRFKDFELIVVDDASNDDTPAVLTAISDPRLHTLRLDTHRGASFARNAGIEATHAPLLAFIDSDDRWQPEKLERQMVVMDAASDNVGMCVCSMDVYQDGHRHRLRYRDEELSPRDATARLVAGTGMGTPCWLVRRTAMEAAGGFNNALPRMQDYDCALRLARRFSIHLMSDPLVIAEIGPDSLSASASRYARAIELILKDHHDPFFIDPAGHSHMVFRAGKYYAIEGRSREARRWFKRALRINPLNLRALAGLVLSVTGLFPLFSRIKYRG